MLRYDEEEKDIEQYYEEQERERDWLADIKAQAEAEAKERLRQLKEVPLVSPGQISIDEYLAEQYKEGKQNEHMVEEQM